MKNHVWGWIVGSVIFVMVAGIWVWQLPNIIRHTAKGKDEGFAGIMSLFRGTETSVSSDLTKVQAQLDVNLKKVSQTIATQEAQAAVLQDLKNKIGNKNNIQTATVSPTNANANGNANAPVNK